MNKQTKHLLSLLLTLTMLLGALPMGGLALEQEETAQQTGGQSAVTQSEGQAQADRLQAGSATIALSYSQAGAFVTGADGTLLYEAPVTVYDEDRDGQLTIHDAFVALHQQYYAGGAAGYGDMDSGWVCLFWGDSSGNLSYAKNHGWVGSVMDPV